MIIPDRITLTMMQLKIHQTPQQRVLNQMSEMKLKNVYLIN
jgi:hypothetical protein